ncbi:MAG TPA: ThiF family adenylyltransferase [Dongiaceae bacterium]|nr:ThiF family adenylyltransferase [Dongiaceae bacterium]
MTACNGNDMEELNRFIREQANGDLVCWRAQVEAGKRFGVALARVEDAILALGLLPARYQRNRQAISVGQQLTLFRSRVAVIGCGGLGGYVIEELARLGVGTIIAIDPDVFEEHNLNRQLLSSPATLGRAKVEAAAARVAEINPAVTLVPRRKAYAPENGEELLHGSQVIVDALDSIQTRLALAKTCTELGIPMVHGAIGGWYGQVATQFPGDDVVQKLYRRWVEGKGVEQKLGNPSFTPALVASMEVAEVCKVLLGQGETLHHRKLSVNLLEVIFVSVDMKNGMTAKVEGSAPISPPTAKESTMKDILGTLEDNGSFQTLLGLMEKAGFSGRLQEPGPFTLFAPNDEAFQKVNVEEISGDPDNLTLLLKYHLVEGKLSAAEIAGSEQLMTLSDKSLAVRLEEGVQVIDNAHYVRTDIACTNGIIQVIDNVFLPQFSGWYCSCC